MAKGQLAGSMRAVAVEVRDITGTSINPSSNDSVVDEGNSSITPLGIDATFTGVGINVLPYAMITVFVHANVDSATNGIDIEFSSDGTNWDDHYHFMIDVSNSDTRRFQFPITGKFFRVRYINGGIAQTAFRLQTILHPDSGLTSVHRVADTGDNDDRSVALVKAVMSAKKPNGDYTNIDATAGGNLKVSIEEVNGTADIATETTQLALLAEFQSLDETYYLSEYLLDTAARDMAVNGAITPVLYRYTVPVDTEVEIIRGLVVIEDGPIAFIPGDFAALGAALTNGVEIGVIPSGGSKVIFEMWQTNREIRDTMFDFDQQFRTDGQYVGRWSFTRDQKDKGLLLTAGDIFEIKIQDDLSALDYMSFKLKGIKKAV